LISSPSARNDPIMSRYREAQGSKEVYSIKLPTWKFNPLIKKKDLAEEFKSKPVESMRDYGCEPPMAAAAWISDEKLIESSFNDSSNAISVTSIRVRTKSRKIATAATFKKRRELKF